jgi:hypothetical protein
VCRFASIIVSLFSSLLQAWVGRLAIDEAESRYTGGDDTKAAAARAPAGSDGQQLTTPLLPGSAAEKGSAGKAGQGDTKAGGDKEEKKVCMQFSIGRIWESSL